MGKKNLENTISEVFTPLGFKKKGNSWTLVNDEITKVINLQKSQFSNRFYINYGYIINSIPLNGLKMHIFYGLGGANSAENVNINELLDSEARLSDGDRKIKLKEHLIEKILKKMSLVTTEKDLLIFIKNLTSPLSNMIPGVVKDHFSL